MKLYLDVEAPLHAGVEVYSVQYAIDGGEPKICLPYRDYEEFQEIVNLLYSPETVLVAYNLPFDTHKLYVTQHILTLGSLASRVKTVTP